MRNPKLDTNKPYEPWEHQRVARDRALECVDKNMPYYALFFEMGCGKTGTTIQILRKLFQREGRILRTLIICPSAVVPVWPREFGLHSRCKNFCIPIQGTKPKRLKAIKSLFANNDLESDPLDRIAVINIDSTRMKRAGKSKRTAPNDYVEMLLKWKPDVVIVDESQRIKDPSSMQSKAVYKLGDQAKYRYILTGTAILNNITDIFGQFRFLDCGQRFGHSLFEFRKSYMIDMNAGMPKQAYFPKWELNKLLEPHINKSIYECASRMKKSEALDLPPLVTQDLACEMGAEQARMYKEMHRDFISYLEDEACVAQTALIKAIRLQQIVSGFIVKENEEVHEFKEVPRLKVLMETIAPIISNDEKVIVWATYRKSYAMIERELKKAKINFVTIYGGQKADDRQKAIDDFQTDPSVQVVVAAPRAAGVGIGLQAASYMIYFSRSYSLEDDLQSEARAHRGGSEIHDKITRINLYCPGTIDEAKAEALRNKENLAENILSIKKYLS